MERNNMISITKKNGVAIKTYTLDVDDLYKLIDRKAYEFSERYKRKPRYIKIPEWVYEAVDRYEFGFWCRPIGNGFINQPQTLFGYIVCPTVSIEQIDDIEVF